MIAPPETLEEIEPEVVQRNDLRLALPTIARNYKTYHLAKEQLKGLQDYVNTLIDKDKNDDERKSQQ